MAVYRYRIVVPEREDRTEVGTVVATSEEEAKNKLLVLDLRNPKLTRLRGWDALRLRFFADIR